MRNTLETSRNAYCTNQGANEDDTQSDPQSEAGTSQSQKTQKSAREEAYDNKRKYKREKLLGKYGLTFLS